jgi:predicted transcriptional regulator
MAPLPANRPHQLSLGPLETEILTIIWSLGTATAREIHEQILSDPDRELAYPSVMTVLKRLQAKGWLRRERLGQRSFCWHPTVTREQATQLQAHQRLQNFLSVGSPDVVAAFADSLDGASLDQLEAIAQRLRTIRQAREDDHA